MHLGLIIKQYRDENKLSMAEFAKKAKISKAYVSVLEKNKDPRNGKPIIPSIPMIQNVANAMGISFEELFNLLGDNEMISLIDNTPTLSSDVQAIVDVSVQLETPRQHKVLNYAKKQLNDQNNEKGIDVSVLKENSTTYQEKQLFPVQVTEGLAAGRGYSYNENNETVTVYTDRDNLQWHNLASFIIGDSMEPKYHNGDVALIQKGFDNIQGAVYAVDYNNKTYMKKLYNDGHQFRLVSINDKYDDILIDIPVDEDIYFNIVGRVVDSFTPVEE